MNSRGHLIISVVKSLLRMFSCAWCVFASTITGSLTCSLIPLALGFLGAEILGVVEELVDEMD